MRYSILFSSVKLSIVGHLGYRFMEEEGHRDKPQCVNYVMNIKLEADLLILSNMGRGELVMHCYGGRWAWWWSKPIRKSRSDLVYSYSVALNCREKFEECNGSQLGGNFYRYKYMISFRIIKSAGIEKD